MKILKFSGIVVGIHLFALILIFANPGCSSSTKPAPVPADTAASNKEPGTILVPGISPATTDGSAAPSSSSSTSEVPLITGINTSPRYSPTRPGSSTATTLQAEPAPQFTPATTYSVVSGDNLTVIAKKNHLTIAELAAANNLKPSAKLQLGQKLIIPGKASGATTSTPTPVVTGSASSTSAKPADSTAAKVAATESVRHTVKSGETLGGIARKYGVKQGDIAVANNISDPQKIRPGMELIIPGWQTPGGKTAAKSPGSATTKPGVDPKPTFAPTPAIESPTTISDPPPSEVPVIKVEDSPAPSK
jgi:LysM repeat protein